MRTRPKATAYLMCLKFDLQSSAYKCPRPEGEDWTEREKEEAGVGMAVIALSIRMFSPGRFPCCPLHSDLSFEID